MPDSNKPVILVGAGIGGLFAALCLHRHGIESVILEKSTQLAEVGAGIQIGANGSRLLRLLDLQDEVEARAVSPAYGLFMRGVSGDAICRYPLNEQASKKYQSPFYQILRADLQAILVDAVNQRIPGCLRLGAELSEIREQPEFLEAVLASGDTVEGRCLIGCDGIHSRTRQLLFDDGLPQFTGSIAWRALVKTTDLDQHLEAGIPKIWIGRDRHLVQYPVASGELINLVACVTSVKPEVEQWQGVSSHEELQQAFKGWCPEVGQLLEKASAALKWGLYERPILSNWRRGKAVLLGDSAHAMLPSLAQGAVMAMEDAYCLATTIGAQVEIISALDQYQKSRLARTTKVQRIARSNLDFFHQKNFKDRLAEKVLSGMGDSAENLISNRFHWLYGYKGD